MVARFYKNKQRYLSRHRVWYSSKKYARSGIIKFVLFALFIANAQAQNFQNSGTYKGTSTGLFRVKGSAIGLPDTVTGGFEFFGANQTVPATNYTKLFLTGIGSTKSSQGGNVGILQTANVDSNVLFQIHSNDTMSLEKINGRLVEKGSVLGKMHKSVDFIPGVDSSDFGGIGLSISWEGTNPGTTSVTRTSGTAISVNGKSSIQRIFDIKATTDSLLNANISFTFSSNELQGQNPTSLDLWRSPNGGISWRRQRVARDGYTLKRTNIASFGNNGRWTAADANNMLGIPNYEWEADSLKRIAGNNQYGRVKKLSDTAFVAKVVDAFNQPVSHDTVKFVITNVPQGAIGQALTTTMATTDSNGQVKTNITFGNVKGPYKVAAFVPGVLSAIDTFTATANSALAKILAQLAENPDTVTSIVPVTITAKDDQNSAVSQEPISFEFMSRPDSLYKFTQSSDTTDAQGKAISSFIFGRKTGRVLAKIYSMNDSTIDTNVTISVLPGKPAHINGFPVDKISIDTVAKVKQFTIALADAYSNARTGDSVQLAMKKPLGSTLDTLYSSVVVIDTLGSATFKARIGEKVGTYNIIATPKTQPLLIDTLKLTAINDIPANMIASNTKFGDTIEAMIPQLNSVISDKYSNSVPNASVHYSVDTAIAGSLSNAIINSDVTGKVTNQFKNGLKTGLFRVYAELNNLKDTFQISVKPGLPQKFLTAQGLAQAQEILTPLDSLFVVKLMDRANNPIQKDTVLFTITNTPAAANGVALSKNLAVTDTNGYASTQLTLGDKIGIYKVQAICKNKNLNTPLEFSAVALHGSARSLAYKVGSNQQKPILTPLDTLVVRLKDIGGNPVPGKPVTFAVVDTPSGTWGYKLSRDTILTDSLGEARTVFTLGSKIGRYGVVARTSVLPSDSIVEFYATATVGNAKTLAQQSGNNQLGQLGDHLQPFVVQVRDTGSNLISNTGVTFTIYGQPDSLTKYDSLAANGVVRKDSIVVTTDSIGLASASLILGSRSGRYMVKASAAGVKDTIFVANAILLMADVNHDDYRNIGDLTAIIDHIIGKKLLTGYDLIAADMYPVHKDGTVGDGIIDIRDAQVCLDSLLNNGWNPTRDWLVTNVSPLLKVKEGPMLLNSGTSLLTSNTDSCYVQTTYIGSRFSLKNTVPIKGLQAVIYMKNPASLDTTDIIFPRAKMMNVDVRSVGKEVSVILWNTNNTPIEPGDSAIFRLPIQLTNNNVDSIHVLMSSGINNDVSLLNSVQEDIRNSIPRDWVLYQNYPNPFNPTTTIEFDVPEVAGKIPRAAIQIFNILGQHIRTLERGIHDAGRYSIVWDGRSENGMHVASGVYFYRLLAGEYASTKKMVMLK